MPLHFMTISLETCPNSALLFVSIEQGETRFSAVFRSGVAVEIATRINGAFHAMRLFSLKMLVYISGLTMSKEDHWNTITKRILSLMQSG